MRGKDSDADAVFRSRKDWTRRSPVRTSQSRSADIMMNSRIMLDAAIRGSAVLVRALPQSQA